MSVIAISAWSHCHGEEIARRVARKLNFRSLGPELLGEVADRWQLPLPKLVAALGKQQTLLGVTPRERRRLLAYLEAAVLEKLAQDKVVTWGLGAHFYVMGVSHVLKVRLVLDWEARVRAMMEEGGMNEAAAAKALKKEDEARARMAHEIYRKQEDDPTLYDLTINLMQIDIEQAVEIVAEAVQHKRFKPMTFSRKLMKDQVLATQVKAELFSRHPDAQVSADGGQVLVTVPAVRRDQEKKISAVRDLARKVKGVASLKVEVVNDFLEEAAESMR